MPSLYLEKDLKQLFFDLHHLANIIDGKEISDAEIAMAPEDLVALYTEEKHSKEFDIKKFYNTHFTKNEALESGYKSDTSKSTKEHIEALWGVLSRRPEKSKMWSSRIPLPYPYIVPGGRFNEIYYWDSYFTMLGLAESGHTEMIHNMVKNFAWMIDNLGLIPNGNRTYFLGRSQPPFFALMVDLLAGQLDESIIIKYLPQLEKEYRFWVNGVSQTGTHEASERVVRVSNSDFLNRYYDNISQPRTEMYTDDIELIKHQSLDGHQLILDIRAACESGWDFSSRWCADPQSLETLCTTDILPVDLNCLLYSLEDLISRGYYLNQDREKHQLYARLAARRKNLIQEYFWCDKSGFFFDYNYKKHEMTDIISAAGLFPLFFGIATDKQAKKCEVMVRKHLLKDGGILATSIDSGQQWDAPNGWAPLQFVAVQGFLNYSINDLASEISNKWISLNDLVYAQTGKMMEKYNVVDTTLESGGGEYPVQDGFGWTNGVYLKLKSLID